MTTMLLERPTVDAPILPPTSQAVLHRVRAVAAAIGGLIDPAASIRQPLLEGCLVMPYAGLAIAGTACRRPLLVDEGEAIVRQTGLDLVLVRYDVDSGVTFDIRLTQTSGWLWNYVASRAEGGDLWFVPQARGSVMIQPTAWGLEVADDRALSDADERRRGMLREFAAPFVAGRI